jgi:hypothetical protein
MSERERFEAWWYSAPAEPKQAAWEAWQAALALPVPAPDTATADQIMGLADAYARVYSFVHDSTMPRARAALRAAVEQLVAERDALLTQPAAQAVPDPMEINEWGKPEPLVGKRVEMVPAAQAVPEPAERAFIRALFDKCEWPDGGWIDGFEFQDIAEEHGLLVPVDVFEPCGEGCRCAEYHGGSDGMSDGVVCYRKAAWLAAAPEGNSGEQLP